ncbi:Uncharacterized protein Fot_25078 [Forsythia ovata]|uniref:DNA-directed RNA polymerase subunit n=1 Tax=Forsythia ovata TaxID=205694 RepID=A0ABD1U843_9LAMI
MSKWLICQSQYSWEKKLRVPADTGSLWRSLALKAVGKGLIRDGTGYVTFPVKYQCVVFRLFKGEIVEAVVSMVNKMNEAALNLYNGVILNKISYDCATVNVMMCACLREGKMEEAEGQG